MPAPILCAALAALATLAATAAAAPLPHYLVSAGQTSSIRQYAPDGAYLGDLVPPGNGLNSPQYMAIDSRGRLLVANFLGHNVTMYDARTGAFLGEFAGGPAVRNPAYLEIDPTGAELIVASIGNNRVLRYDLDSGAPLADLVPPDTVTRPHSLLRLDDGRLLISGQDRIVAALPAGGFADFSVGGQLLRPLNMVYTPDRRKLLVSNYNGQVQRLDALSGAQLGAFTSETTFRGPDDLSFTTDGRLAVAYNLSNRVRLYDVVTGQPAGNLARPVDGLRGPNHVLYVPEVTTAAPVALVLLLSRWWRR